MKKKLLSLLLALTLVLSMATGVSATTDRITSGDWTYFLNGDYATLLVYEGNDTEVTVPATIDGHPVDTLGLGLSGSAFNGVAETMTSVTVEDGITYVNNSVFKNCTALKSVTLPDSVFDVGMDAFNGCTSLTDVDLGDGLKQIGSYAFLNCTSLTSIRLPASLELIYDYALGYTGEWGDTDQVDGFTIYGYTDTAAQEYAESWHFDFVDMGGNYDNSGRCGDSAYWEFTAATGTLHIYGHGGYMNDYDEVDQIPWFVHMPFITNAVVEDVMDICNNAFHGCSNLTTVTMNDTVETIGTAAFKDTPKLTDIKLSANLEHISTDAFYGSGLTSIELPDGLISIGTQAFYNTPLTAIVIPDSVTSISQSAFDRCEKLESVVLSSSMREIANNTFHGCTSLRSINFPDGLEVIGFQAFTGTALERVELPDSVIAIHDHAFMWCSELTYVKLPAGLQEAGFRCFGECPKLSTIVMPEGLELEFGQWFFLDCDSLTDIDFHTAPVIGWAMYQDCDGLTNLTIPGCVTTLRNSAFAYCDALTYVTVPESVTTVDNAVFSNCDKLTGIAFRGDAPSFSEFAFQETATTCYYPTGNATWTEEVLQQYGGTITWVPYEVLPFTDVPASSFYYNSVAWAVELGVTNGLTETTFGPNKTCNRAQVVTFLWRAAGSPEPTVTENPFVDVVKGSFYEKAVLWAVEKGITTGTDATHFSPNQVCNRATVVTFLYRAAGSPAVESAENPFADVPAGDWYTAPVLWAVENGITNGLSAAEFGPNASCNRAQIVTFLYRAYN